MYRRTQKRTWRFAQTSPLTKLPRSTYFRAYRLSAGTAVDLHRHRWCQFLYARSGIMQVVTHNSSLVVPPLYGMWLPAGTDHAMYATEDVELESLYIDAHAQPAMGTHCRVVLVSELVREFIHYGSTQIRQQYDENGSDGLKIRVLLELLRELPDAPLRLPLPADTRLADMCTEIQASPSLTHSLEDWALRLNMSPRTLSRHFLSETGMTYQSWRQRQRLLHSLSLLKAGKSVTRTALELGYGSASAYVYAFRQFFGRSPKRFYGKS